MGGPGSAVAACGLSPAPPTDVECDFHCPSGNVSLSVAIHKGSGSVAFAAVSLDGKPQSITSPVTVTLSTGQHVVRFVLAFSDPTATAVLQEACTPPQDLLVIDAQHPLGEIRICVP